MKKMIVSYIGTMKKELESYIINLKLHEKLWLFSSRVFFG
ncbi:hypothetical protein SRABI84_00525 [Peribacillus simplex]|nr:hypothetical protein SRABI84_00525 [Peribacillus simplex]